MNYSEDALGNRRVNAYYDGTELESGGGIGKLRQVEQRDSQNNILSLASFTYDVNGKILKASQARNSETDLATMESFYNGLGAVERSIDPELGESRTFYDSSGQVESVKDRYGNATSYLYNRNGVVVQTTFPDTSVSRSSMIYGYGTSGKGSASIVEEAHFEGGPVFGTRTEYNEIGQVVKVERLKNFRITIAPDGMNYLSAFEELPGGVVVM